MSYAERQLQRQAEFQTDPALHSKYGYWDFPDFYAHPFIARIAPVSRWTVSTSNKVPINAPEYIYSNKYYYNKYPESDSLDLDTLCKYLPHASNHAFYMDSIRDRFILVDVEPKCPDDIKLIFLQMDYIYGEVSLSGKGYHLVFNLPDCFDDYEYARLRTVMKDPENGNFEIMQNHWVTFTRNMIQSNPHPKYRFSDFYKNYARNFNTPVSENEYIEPDTSAIDNFDKRLEALNASLNKYPYSKTPYDFLNDGNRPDLSRYEFNVLRFVLARILRMETGQHFLEYLKNGKEAPLEFDSKALNILAWKGAESVVPARKKHQQTRSKMPFLLYEATVASASVDTDSLGAVINQPFEHRHELVRNVFKKMATPDFFPKTRTDYSDSFRYYMGIASRLYRLILQEEEALFQKYADGFALSGEQRLSLLYLFLCILPALLYDPASDTFVRDEPWLLYIAKTKISLEAADRIRKEAGDLK